MGEQPSRTRTIIFDLGGVYFSDGTKRAALRLSSAYGLDRDAVYSYLTGEWGSEWRAGHITEAEFWHQFCRAFEVNNTATALSKIWFEEYEIDESTAALVRDLSHAGNEVLYLSDNVPERVAFLDRKYCFLAEFVSGVFSYEVGVRKPNATLYSAIIEKTSQDASKCVYVDDVPAFLEPARALGMTVLLFEGSEKLRLDLAALGVPVAQ